MAENTVDPTGRRGGKSRRELFNEQLTSVAELKNKLSKESAKPTGLWDMEQTAQPVGEVPTSPLAGMLASKRATGYSEKDRNLEAASSEAEGRPSYFDLREGYGHVRRTIRADKAKAWQASFEKLKESSTLGEIRQSPARGVGQSDREYHEGLIKSLRENGKEVPAELQKIADNYAFNDRVKPYRERGEKLPPELEAERARRYPTTQPDVLYGEPTPNLPQGTSHQLIKKADGNIHVRTFDGENETAVTKLTKDRVNIVTDVFSDTSGSYTPKNPHLVPVIHRNTFYTSDGVKLDQNETPKLLNSKTGRYVRHEDDVEPAPVKQHDETAYQNLKVQRAGLYRDYGPGSKPDRQAVFDQVSQGNNLAHDKVKQWMERQKPAAVTNFFEKNGTSNHGMSDEALIQWHHTEKAKDAEAKKAAQEAKKNNQKVKEVKIHNDIVDAMGIPK